MKITGKGTLKVVLPFSSVTIWLRHPDSGCSNVLAIPRGPDVVTENLVEPGGVGCRCFAGDGDDVCRSRDCMR